MFGVRSEAGAVATGADKSSVPAEHPAARMEVLAITSSEEDWCSLRAIFGRAHWDVRCVVNLEEAREFLHGKQVSVVISDCHLRDNKCWKAVLAELEALADPPELVVVSRLADHLLWAEVLNLGAYDLLMKPFDEEELLRVVKLASDQWEGSRSKRHAVMATASL